jgi:predicted RNA-binding Zn ribbon-like protein
MTRRTLGMPRDEYLAAVGETVEPGGRAPAPGPLHTLQRFINTFNREYPERDRLASPTQATEWLRRHGLMDDEDAVDEAGRADLISVREALRALAGADAAAGAAAERTLARASRRAQFVLRMTPQRSRLEASAPGVDGAIGRLLAEAHAAFTDGSWARLKACRQCGYAFYDRSKNRSGEWCAMSVCGNRVKNRSYRSRRPSGLG